MSDQNVTPQQLLAFARSPRIDPPHAAIAIGIMLLALWSADTWPTDELGVRFVGMWLSGLGMGWSLRHWWIIRSVHQKVIADLEKQVRS